MNEEELRQLARKGRRVGGMLVIMLGAGAVLESPALWAGLSLMAGGVALYASGFMAKSGADVLAGEVREES